MRAALAEALQFAVEEGNARRESTIRLILAAIKDRDIAAHAEDRCEGATDSEIAEILTTILSQRESAAQKYEDSGRLDLAEQERDVAATIQSFLPAQLGEAEIEGACTQVMQELGAQGLRDMGRCMGTLKARYMGRMDFVKASGYMKNALCRAAADKASALCRGQHVSRNALSRAGV